MQELLKTFSKQDWKNFGLFLQSPYFTRSEKFQRFYIALQDYYPKFSVTDEERKVLYQQALQSNSFSEAGYRNLCSDFLEMAQRFLALETGQSPELNNGYALIKELVQRGLFNLAEKNMRKVEVQLSGSTLHLAERLRIQSWLNDLKITLTIAQNRHKYQGALETMSSGTPERPHTQLLLTKVFTHLSNYIKANHELKRAIDKNRLEPYLQLYHAESKHAPFELSISYHTVMLLYTDNEEHYWTAKKLLLDHLSQIHHRDAENALIPLVSFANSKVSVDAAWHQEVFELYDVKLRNKFYENMRYLSYISLFAAFINAVQMSKKGYASLLLQEFLTHIHPGVQQPLANLCYAWLDFMDGKIDAAHEKLVLVETENLLIKYELRVLQCLIYYHNQSFDVLQNALESFRQFNAYNKTIVEEATSEQYGSFIRMLQLLMKLTPNPGAKKFEMIVQDIRMEHTAYLKHWFLEKAETLRKRQ